MSCNGAYKLNGKYYCRNHFYALLEKKGITRVLKTLPAATLFKVAEEHENSVSYDPLPLPAEMILKIASDLDFYSLYSMIVAYPYLLDLLMPMAKAKAKAKSIYNITLVEWAADHAASPAAKKINMMIFPKQWVIFDRSSEEVEFFDTKAEAVNYYTTVPPGIDPRSLVKLNKARLIKKHFDRGDMGTTIVNFYIRRLW